MIEINGLAHIGIRITDFERAKAFYQMFGFDVVREDYVERVVVLHHASGIEINLLDSANDTNEGNNILMDEDLRYPGFTHLAISVRDIDHVQTALKEQGITITEGPVKFGDGTTSVFFRDPDHNVIELSQPQSRSLEKIS
jgi:lactoylglutathione lyase